MKMRCLEMRAHGRANRGEGRKAWNDMEMICKHANRISTLKCGGKQSRNMAKVHTKHGMIPKCDIRRPKWPIAIECMHNMDMEWKYSSKEAPRKAFSSLKHGQTASIDRATMACKNGAKRGVLKQVMHAMLKLKSTLLQHWWGTKNMNIYSRWHPPNQYENMLKMSCKN